MTDNDNETATLKAQNAQLAAQVQRLTKALDEATAAASASSSAGSSQDPPLDLTTRRHVHMRSLHPPIESYHTILYRVDAEERVAYITLNRPDHLNAILWPMPWEIREAVARANDDERVHCIVLSGAGRGFCSGYDLKHYAEGERGTVAGSQRMPWDPAVDYMEMKECTDCYMALHASYKPTIAMVHGFCVAGGSDIALCCDLVVMAENAKIGYPPARMWGSPTTHQWTARIGAEQAKRMLLTGDLIDGVEAARIGLVLRAVPAADLEASVLSLTRRMKGVPTNQLFFNKLICNMAGDGGASLAVTQQVATMLDGNTRHTPEGVRFQQMAQKQGFQAAIATLRADPMEGRQRKQQQQTATAATTTNSTLPSKL